MAKKLTLEDAKNFMLDFYSKNTGVDKDTAWNSFLDTVDKTNRKLYEDNQIFQNSVKGYYERLKNENSGTSNEKGSMSKADNLPSVKIEKEIDKAKKEPKTEESSFKIKGLELAAKNALKQMEGKTSDEQKEIVSEILPEEKEQEEEKKDIAFKITPEKKEEVEETEKEIEKKKRKKEINDKSSAFTKGWASTHPTIIDFLRSEDLTWGQKVALVGSLLANMGANVTLGAKAGFEHGAFNGVPWDVKQAIDKYSNQEIEKVLGGGEQEEKAKAAKGDFWKKYREENGEEATDELMALVDLYGDNPGALSSRLKSMGIYKSADEIKEMYADLEKTTLSESVKQKKLETEAQRQALKAQEILTAIEKNKLEVDDATKAKLIEATNALNDFNNKKYTSDKATYNFEKGFGIVKDAINVVEGVAGALTGKVVGTVKDGIIKARGIPQKIVRADGTEIRLDPNDNVYATKNELTTEKDDGSDIVHMTQSDEAVTVQKKLGYCGGVINKDFDYYLSKLRG